MMTLPARVAQDRIKIVVTFVDTRRDDQEWEHNAWKVTLRRYVDGRKREITTPFMSGMALSEPGVCDVLSSLISDAASAQESFRDWCDGFGYDTDSRKAFETYRACERVARRLRRFLGDDWEEYMWRTDGY